MNKQKKSGAPFYADAPDFLFIEISIKGMQRTLFIMHSQKENKYQSSENCRIRCSSLSLQISSTPSFSATMHESSPCTTTFFAPTA